MCWFYKSVKNIVLQVERQQAVSLSCNTEDPWEIPIASLKYIRKIDEGDFGEVWKGSCRWNNARSVAIKICEGVIYIAVCAKNLLTAF